MSEKLTKAQIECLQGMHRWGSPVTGSRLSRILEHRFSDWAAPKLRALRARGLVQIHDKRSGQKYYTLTPAGRLALQGADHV